LGWQLLQRCSAEIEQGQHHARQLEHELDRLEFLRDLADGWRRLSDDSDVSVALRQLILLSWTRPLAAWRPLLEELLAGVAWRPRQALDQFDQVQQRASAVLAQLGRLLAALEESSEPPLEPRPPATVTALVLEFLEETDWFKYQTWRP